MDGSQGDDNGNISIKGSDGVTLDIPKDEITYPDNETNRYDINTTKTGSYSKDGKLTYTVYVYSLKGTPGDITFEDVIEATGLTLGDPTVKVEKETVTRYYNPDNGGYNPNGDSFTSQEIDQSYNYADGKLSMTLPQIGKAGHSDATDTEWEKDVYTRYKITYTFDVSDLGDNAYTDNKVSTVSSKNNTTVKAEAEKHVDVKTTVDDNVTKSGIGGGAGAGAGTTDYISWTITMNKNEDNIVGAQLRDEMLKKLIPGHFMVTPDKGYDLVYDEDGQLIGMDFKDDGSGENTNTYRITYRTPAQSNWNNGENGPVSNTVDFTHGGKDESATGKVDDVPAARVDKTVGDAEENADGKTVTVNWTVKITVPADALPAGTVITDDPTKDSNGNPGGTQYRTRQQALDWASGIYWASYGHDGLEKIDDPSLPSLTDGNIAEIKFLGSDGKEYTLSQVQASADEALTYTVATIILKQDLVTPDNATYLMFQYTTTADITGAGTDGTNYYNTASVGSIKHSGTYTYTKSGVTKTDEEGSTDKTAKVNEDGSLTWKIKVTLGKNANKLTITDALPEGVTLVSISGEDTLNSGETTLTPAKGGAVSGQLGSCALNGTYDSGKNTLTVDVTSKNTGGTLSAGQYTLVVNCQVDMTAEGYEAGKTYTFTNSAAAKADNAEIGSADQTQDWTEDVDHESAKVVDKSGAWDNNARRFKYSIALNLYGKDIVEGSDVLTLTDAFEYYPKISGHPAGDYTSGTTQFDLTAWLVPDSVQLYEGKLHLRAILAVLLVVLITSVSVAQAAGSAPDLTRQGSITVTLRDAQNGAAMSGGELTLYQVADAVFQDGNMAYRYVNGFENCGVSLANLEGSALADQLEKHRAASTVGKPQTPDANGQLTYSGLTAGLYLLVQTKAADGFETIQPFLVSLPMGTDSGWAYHVDASPKVGVKKPDSPDTPHHPDTPTTPDTPNNPDTPNTPDTPDNPNTPNTPDTPDNPNTPDNPDTPNSPDTPQNPGTPQTPGPRLPQTGQLNWPIPVLSISGLLLLGAGWLLRKKGTGK